ncbi:MAG TPA: FkbM family methyltransferase [Solirubrobacteraceae bacterium]
MSLLVKTRKLARLTRHPVYRNGLRHRVAAAVEHRDVPFRASFASVVDAGASRGQFALFARGRWPAARLLCFEPLPGPRAVLERVLADHPAARVLPYALDETAGERAMHVSRRDDSSSLLAITDRQTAVFPGTEEVSTEPVAAVRLDEALQADDLVAPTLLKIDVQGAELAVLRGGAGLLGALDEILVECSFQELYAGQPLVDDVVAFLHEHGFALAGFGSQRLDAAGRAVQADLLFARAT